MHLEQATAEQPLPPTSSVTDGARLRVLAVLRTLRWAHAHLGEVGPHLGAASARLIDQAAESWPEAGDLDGLQGALFALDLSGGDARVAVLEAALAEAERLLPEAAAPAVQAPPARRPPRRARDEEREPRAAREDRPPRDDRPARPERPSREERSERQSRDDRAERPAREERGDGRADGRRRRERRPAEAVAPLSPEELAAQALAAQAKAEETQRRALDSELDDADGRRRRARRQRVELAPPPPPEPLPLGHPEGTGQPLSVLGLADPEDLEALESAGVHSVADLLCQPPVQQLRVARGELDGSSREGAAVWRGRVLSRSLRLSGHGRLWELALAMHGEVRLACRWVGRVPRGWAQWEVGAEVGVVGTLIDTDDGLVLYQGEPVGIDGRGSGVLPEYDIPDVDDVLVRDLVAAALERYAGDLEDILPASLLEAQRLLPIDEALRDAHFPANASGRGRVRMAFEELLLLQIGVAWRAGKGQVERGQSHKALHDGVGQLEHQHSISLDDAQEAAFCEIRRDLLRPRPMVRLLQGDVGAGKGLVALFSAVVVANNGGQVAVVAPDALAAERRFLYAESLLRSIGITALYVGDAPDHAQLDAIRRGEAQVVYGTAQILLSDLGWKRLGLVIAEERGPYGTVTPGTIRTKGTRPDLLVITRAPIPSSLACTVFGDFDVSVVAAAERPRVHVEVMAATEREKAYGHLRTLLAAGRQAYVAFPVQDGRDLLSVQDALRMAKALQAEFLEGAKVGVYCSAMSREERSRVFDDFQHRRIDVLVCTTFIEDAPPVANAAGLVVEYADLNDMIRLHRLRTHVAYGNAPGLCCFVMSDSSHAAAREHAELVAGEVDGFRLAELDLQNRGPAALLGERAAEMPEFLWADPPRDRELLLRARAEAFRMIDGEPELRRLPAIANAVSQRWGEWLGDGSAAGKGRKGKAPDRAATRRRRRRRRR